jgi:hypothetical protein
MESRIRARRVSVSLDHADPDLAGHDYADAFEVHLPGPDTRTAEQWLRSGLEESPAVVRRLILLVHRHVLGFELAPVGSPDHVLGWAVVGNEPDTCRLETSSTLAHAVLLAQRTTPQTAALQTFLFYRRPTAARRIWAVVGPLHRTIAPLLLRRAARADN